MKTTFHSIVALTFAACAFAGEPAAPAGLQFDAESKTYAAKPGEPEAFFTFHATNVTAAPITIKQVSATCGCTTVQLPASPYVLGAGSNVAITAKMTLAGKQGDVIKSVLVDTSAGLHKLLVKTTVPVAEAK